MLKHIGDAQAQLAAANRGEPRGSGNGRYRGIVCWRNETYVKRWRFGRGVVQILVRCGTSHRVASPGRWSGELSLSNCSSVRANRDQWETTCSNARMQESAGSRVVVHGGEERTDRWPQTPDSSRQASRALACLRPHGPVRIELQVRPHLCAEPRLCISILYHAHTLCRAV